MNKMLEFSYYLEVVRKIFIEDLTSEHALALLRLSRDIFEVVSNNLQTQNVKRKRNFVITMKAFVIELLLQI